MPCRHSECPFYATPDESNGSRAPESHCLVEDSVKQIRFSKGDILFSENQPSCCVYALRSGIVKVCDVSASGNEQIVGIATPRRLMVGLRSLSTESYTDCAIAETDVSACKIRKKALISAVGREPQIAVRLIDALNSQLSMSRALMRVSEHHGAQAKIAAFLILIIPQLNGGRKRIEFPFSRSEIAGILSLSEETVCRQMAAMRRDNILYAPRGHIEIYDWDRLRELAEPSAEAA